MLKYFVSLLIFNYIQLSPLCKEGLNNCKRCDPLTNLCVKCDLDIYSPDEKGGCSPLGKCLSNKNYCQECDDEEKNCKNCEVGFYPDSNGACSFIKNCEISYKGYCLKCIQDYILIGEEQGIKICKYLYSEDLQKCEIINNKTGLCDTCEKDYFLNSGDKKCSEIENCYESIYGRCLSCNRGFYLNIKTGSCNYQYGSLLFCKETIDGKKCDKCDDDFFFDEKGNCTSVNYCSEGMFNCKKCIDGYFLSKDKNSCTKEENCYSGDKFYGICNYCIENYYIDLKDRKCKLNKEDKDFNNCIKIENDFCILCENGYNLSEDGKCTTTKNCAEVLNGKCITCSDNYYLGLDNRCSNIKHCIYSDSIFQCKECEDGYYYNSTSQICLQYTEEFENCKLTTFNGSYYCYYCKTGFYINQTDHLCYNNKEENEFFKCLMTDMNGEYCINCEDNYYIGYKDHKCSKIYGCEISENEEKCLECDNRHCLDVKTGKCENNEEIKDEEQKLYYRCKKTNEEGNACEICLDEYELSNEGYCVDKIHCIEEKDGVCVKCQSNNQYSSCLNKYFGCVPTSYMKCIECNNNLDFDICTKCRGDYKLNDDGICVKIEDE